MSTRAEDLIERLVPETIRRRFVLKFVTVVLVAVLVSAGIGTFYYVAATDRVEGQVTERVTSTAQLQADGLSAWISGLRDQTRTQSAAGEFQRGSESEIQLFLMDKARQLPADVVAIHYVTANTGRVVASTDRSVDGATLGNGTVPWANDMSDVDAVTNDVSNVVVANEPYRSPVSDERVIAFISSPPKNTEHVVVVEGSLAQRASAFHQTTANATTTVRRHDGAYVMGDRTANASLPSDELGATKPGIVETDGNVVGYAPVDGTDWTLTTSVPEESAYSMRNYVGSSLLTTILGTIAVFALATVTFGRRAAGTLDELTRKARRMERGDLATDLSTSRVDEFGRLFGAFDAMRDSLREEIRTAEAATERAKRARADADEARTGAERLNERLQARADDYSRVMAACADGDLTRRMDTAVESDAMRRIAVAYNEVMEEWEATIREVRAFSEAVQTANDDVAETVSDVRERSVVVRDTAEEMADGATTQSERLQAVWVELEDLSASVEEVSATADAVRTSADDAVERSESGREAAAAAADALDDIASSTSQTVDQVETLERLMADVEGVTDLIADVAEQTNMLALNANIEAARVDTDNDGFAVVADEIKELADETVEATQDIDASIDRMRSEVESTIADTQETDRRVAAGTQTVEEALDAFDEIVDGIEETTAGVREIDRVTADQAESTEEVVTAVEQVTEISDRTAEESATVATQSTRQATAVGDVDRDLSRLAERAEELDDLLHTFRLDHEGTADVEGDEPATADAGASAPLPVGGDGSVTETVGGRPVAASDDSQAIVVPSERAETTDERSPAAEGPGRTSASDDGDS